MTNKIPQGWVECKMKDVLEFSQGIQVDVNLQQDSKISDEYIRFLRIVDFTQKTEPPRYVLNPPTHVIVTNDDISMVRYGAAGFVCTGLNGAIANNLFRIIPKENIFNNRFLYYFLIGDSFQNYIKHKQTGTTMQAISFKIMNEANIVVPPLDEQKRIVEKIEEEFGKIDEGVEKLKLAQEQIKQYRQSVLKSAFEGKLYNNSKLKKEMRNKLPQGWVECEMKKVLEFSQGIQVDVNMQYDTQITNEYVRFLRIVDFTQGTEPPRYIINPPKHVIVRKDDISMVRYGAAGFVCTGLEGAIANNLFRIVPKGEIFNKRFLYYYLISSKFQNYIKHKQTGTTMQAISFKVMNEARIVVPSLNEQKQIVLEIEKRFEVADEAERVIAKNLEKAEQLKQSILKKAFEGRLVPQDPTDEPASVLLEKIKTERGK